MMVKVVTLTISIAWGYIIWELLWFHLRVTTNYRAKRWYCWLTNLTSSYRILRILLVAEVFGDYHLLLVLIRADFSLVWCLRLVHHWHLAMITIIDRVECIFVLALKGSNHLKTLTSNISLKVIWTGWWSQNIFLFLASRGTSEVVVALFIDDWAHGLPLAILLSWHHVLRAHEVIVLLVRSSSPPYKSRNTIIWSVARVVMVVLLVEWRDSLVLVLVVDGSAHMLAMVEVAWLMVCWRLRNEASRTSEVILPLIINPLSANFGIRRSSRIRHLFMAVGEIALSELALGVHHLELSWSVVLFLHAHVQVVATHAILLRAGRVLLVHGLEPILENFKIAKLVEISYILIWHLWHVVFLVLCGWVHSLLAVIVGFVAVGHVFEVQAALDVDFWVVCMKVVWCTILTGNNDFLIILVVNIWVDLIWA